MPEAPPARHAPEVPGFRPAWWCRNRHLQTLLPLLSKQPLPPLRRERLELPDGDFLDLDWTPRGSGPCVLVLHGLEGSVESHYARRILRAIGDAGWQGVLMHFRGCSGEPNRLARRYHSGETGDLEYVVEVLRKRDRRTPLAVIGYSLGGNVLLKWLGENGDHVPVTTAVAISVPFMLDRLADHMNHGFARFYQAHLVRSLVKNTLSKRTLLAGRIDIRRVPKLHSFWEFDDAVTAPLHGFENARRYYQASSSRPFIGRIRIPTLILHARDDPFMVPEVIPQDEELGPGVQLELTEGGGHVGFIEGGTPWHPRYWLERRIVDYLRQHL
jgi:predicted alpha/beta-fold hydrolase